MPEGDNLHQMAALLRDALAGQRITSVEGSHRGLRPNGRRLNGHTVESIEAHGKHLLVHFDHGWTIRTHLSMPGQWHLYRKDERWRKTEGKARVVLRSDDWVAVCFSAPTVQVGLRDHVAAAIAHLGPDLISEEPDGVELVGRARRSSAETAADLLLDQTVMSGLGNVYKSETLFLEHINPATPIGELSDEEIVKLARRGRKLISANTRSPRRTTTGDRRRGHETWVYGRAGQPCRRCGTGIATARHGPLDRTSYWCPTCQKSPTEPAQWSQTNL